MTSRILLALGVAIGLMFVVLYLPVRSGARWIDPITGSMKEETCVFGLCSTTIRRSELERWVVRDEGSYRPSWHFLSRSHENLFGTTLVRGCSSAPANYMFGHDSFNREFVRVSTGGEIREFLKVMRLGTGVEKGQAVDAASRRTLDRTCPECDNPRGSS